MAMFKKDSATTSLKIASSGEVREAFERRGMTMKNTADDDQAIHSVISTWRNEMKKITPHLWFDKEAKEAAEFYVSAFPDSKITNTTTIHGVPSPTGDSDIISFELAGQPFMAINAGPEFTFNPSISFIVNFDPSRDEHALEHLDELWSRLSEGGTMLMPLQEYPFSKRYGWTADRYGLSWQLMLTDPEGDERPFIIPSLMFVGDVCGKAEEATDFYISIFANSPGSEAMVSAERGLMSRYPAGMEPDQEGTVTFTDFRLLGTWFAAIDSAHEHLFTFSEALSLIVLCDTQDEIDYFWEKLSAVPEAEQCGWLKDKYGVSWQIVPTAMNEMMANGSREQIDRVTQTFLPMKKFNIAKLKEAYARTTADSE
jgi:predicted 3-demethylubiquinone-9 3-methyltransferase (glyoxalase superfamily)